MTEQQALQFARQNGLNPKSIRDGRQVVVWHQDVSEAQFAALESAGWNVNRITRCCSIYTEQDTPRRRYEQASEAEQIEMDFSFLTAGGHLSPEKMQRLRDAGKIVTR